MRFKQQKVKKAEQPLTSNYLFTLPQKAQCTSESIHLNNDLNTQNMGAKSTPTQ